MFRNVVITESYSFFKNLLLPTLSLISRLGQPTVAERPVGGHRGVAHLAARPLPVAEQQRVLRESLPERRAVRKCARGGAGLPVRVLRRVQRLPVPVPDPVLCYACARYVLLFSFCINLGSIARTLADIDGFGLISLSNVVGFSAPCETGVCVDGDWGDRRCVCPWGRSGDRCERATPQNTDTVFSYDQMGRAEQGLAFNGQSSFLAVPAPQNSRHFRVRLDGLCLHDRGEFQCQTSEVWH